MINQPTQKSQGFIVVVAIMAVVVVAIAASAYVYFAKKTGETNPFSVYKKATASLALNPNCDYKDADLCKFINNLNSQQYVTISTKANDPEHGTSESIFRTIGDDKTHTTYTVKDKETYNLISIGNTTYTKDYADNKWWKMVSQTDETNSTDFEFDVPSATASADPEDKVSFTAQGKEACGSLTCFKYKSVTGTDTEGAEYLWFDDTQYLLRKVESITADGDKTTLEYSYDSFTITAPTDVKEASQDQAITPDSNSMTMPQLSAEEQQMLEDMGVDLSGL